MSNYGIKHEDGAVPECECNVNKQLFSLQQHRWHDLVALNGSCRRNSIDFVDSKEQHGVRKRRHVQQVAYSEPRRTGVRERVYMFLLVFKYRGKLTDLHYLDGAATIDGLVFNC